MLGTLTRETTMPINDEDQPTQTFGQMLRDARSNAKPKITQADLADAVKKRGLKMSQGYVSLIERTAGTSEEPSVSRDLVIAIATVLRIDRDTALLAAGHNPKSPRHRIEDDNSIRMRILTEFELVAPDGSSRPVQLSDLTPGMRKQLAHLILSGVFDEGGEETDEEGEETPKDGAS
jgi:hypothetical protein